MTMSPRRVLLVLSEAGTGGMQAMVGVLAEGLADVGVEVHLVAGGDAPMPAAVTEVVERGATVLHRLPSPRGAGLLQWTLGLRTLCRKIRPEIVHGHGLRTAWPIAIVADRRRVLVTCHGLPPDDLERSARLVRRSRITVASVGPGLADALRRAGLDCWLIENGVPDAPLATDRDLLATSLGIDPSTPLVVQAARLSPQKDPLTAVAAIAAVPGATLLLLGGGVLEEDVAGLARSLEVTDRVVIAGWSPEARSILGAADVVLLSSLWEGQPLVLVEAAAAGVPIVATDCPGVGDWLVDGVEALLSPSGDPAALAKNIGRALDDHVLRDKLIGAGALLAERHTAASMVDRHIDCYQALLAR